MNLDPFTESKRPAGSSAGSTLRTAVWEMYMGVGIKEGLCPLCWRNRIQSNAVKHGFECAHIVSRIWMTEKLSVYYLVPSCSSCNGECNDMCIFDYLYVQQRIGQLRKLIMTIYRRFVAEYEHEWAANNRMIHLMLNHLYGPRRFSVDGGIQNRKQIYEIARTEQYQWLIEMGAELEKQMSELQTMRRLLLEENIKPMQLE